MVLGWRRAFCTSVPKDPERDSTIIKCNSEPTPSPKLSGFFSGSSTPRLHSQPVSSPNLRCRTAAKTPVNVKSPSYSAPQSPKLHCKTRISSRFFQSLSTPSSPRSPSTFSFFKSSLRGGSKNRCGLCVQSVKTGQGMAIFTAECGHNFHYPCVFAHFTKKGSLTCPICNCTWKEMDLLNNIDFQFHETDKRCVLKVYNDDEPLSSPISGSRFNPIPESDETDDNEFPGFFTVQKPSEAKIGKLKVALLPEAAVVSVGKRTETYAVVLTITAPAAPLRRAPIDLVTVVNVSRNVTAEKMHLMKKAMRLVVSSLSAADRLSIVAYSATSKRLMLLRRMTISGKRGARKIIDAIVAVDSGAAASATDSLKKAAKVLEDRREINSAASILLFTDGYRSGPLVTSTRFSSAEIPLHSISLSGCVNAPPGDTIAKCISSLLSVVIQGLKIQVESKAGEILAVYSYPGRPALLGSGSSWFRVGDFCSQEERELLIELKVPPSYHNTLSVRWTYKDPSTEQPVFDKDRSLSVPKPRTIGSSTPEIQRLRCLFVTTRAVVESRKLRERNDPAGAQQVLASARALVLQSGSGSGEEFVLGLEAELADTIRKRQDRLPPVQLRNREAFCTRTEEKAVPLTPWKAAERLAKLAIMKKSLNRVGDLHGFENARF